MPDRPIDPLTIERIIATVVIVLLCALSAAAGALYMECKMRNDAIAAGCAEYYIDSKNNKRWRWAPVNTPAKSEAINDK